jgi:hypothetical protein
MLVCINNNKNSEYFNPIISNLMIFDNNDKMQLMYRYSRNTQEKDSRNTQEKDEPAHFHAAISAFKIDAKGASSFDDKCNRQSEKGGGIFSAKTIRRLRRKSSYSGSTRCLKRRKLRNGKTRVHLTKRRHLQK